MTNDSHLQEVVEALAALDRQVQSIRAAVVGFSREVGRLPSGKAVPAGRSPNATTFRRSA